MRWICILLICVLAKVNCSMTLQQIPCNFMSTINITGGYVDSENNFVHNGIKFRPGKYAQYNYIIVNFTERVTVEPHIRGCLCEYKSCIRLCCLYSEKQNPNCIQTTVLQVPTQKDGEISLDLENDEFGILIGRPCADVYKLEPLDYPDDDWSFMKVRKFFFFSQIDYLREDYFTDLKCMFV
jgi:G protein-coupled receptor Mth (Methuselah protein)